jgi:Icc-related predicted phosphoesterase
MVIELDRYHEMISSGWCNPTPWHTYREEDETCLRTRIDAMVAQVRDLRNSVFNLHAPPYGSTLDEVPELTEDLKPKLGGRSLVPVGSRAVHDVIKEHQPLLGLHGHIHEGKGAIRVGKTLCINPGSMYEQGRLLGAVVNLARNKIKNYVLTTG